MLEERCKGSSYPTLDDDDIRAVMIPEVDKTIMEQIQRSVENSHSARCKAHTLLELAKRAVELAIDESESVALKYLTEHMEG